MRLQIIGGLKAPLICLCMMGFSGHLRIFCVVFSLPDNPHLQFPKYQTFQGLRVQEGPARVFCPKYFGDDSIIWFFCNRGSPTIH